MLRNNHFAILTRNSMWKSKIQLYTIHAITLDGWGLLLDDEAFDDPAALLTEGRRPMTGRDCEDTDLRFGSRGLCKFGRPDSDLLARMRGSSSFFTSSTSFHEFLNSAWNLLKFFELTKSKNRFGYRNVFMPEVGVTKISWNFKTLPCTFSGFSRFLISYLARTPNVFPWDTSCLKIFITRMISLKR